MKANLLPCVFLMLLATAVRLNAEQQHGVIWPSDPFSVVQRGRTNEPSSAILTAPGGSVIKMTFYEGDKFNALFSTNAPEIRAAAESGDASAQVLLGWRLIESSLKNDEKADKWINGNSGTNAANEAVEVVKWFFKAADQGREDAENNLGTCYANGFGVKKNEAEAVKWFVKAAKQGDNESSLWLGRAYETGEGVETNITLAEQWYRHAALHENVSAQEWFRKAAENGDASAQCFVGQLYDFGFVGVNVPLKDHPGAIQTDYPENPNEAVKWYRQAAAQGNATAQNNLGAHYLTGDGIAMDYVEAYKWLNLAAASTDDEASDIAGTQRDNLAKIMTSDQIAEAQELSREFKPRTESGSNNSTSSDQPVASGTGFFITDDGYLISNYHVVKDATKVRLLTSAGLIDAKVVQVDAANDLALLKADGRFAPLPIAASRSVNLGGTVATVGFPDIGLQGFAPKLAKGEIASLSGAADDPRYFQISVPVQPGNSGGALVDDWGNVIGIVSAKLDASVALAASGALPENVNYAVKSSFLLSFLESVPAVSAKLKAPNTKDEKFEDVVKSAQAAAVLVLVY